MFEIKYEILKWRFCENNVVKLGERMKMLEHTQAKILKIYSFPLKTKI